MYPVIAAIIGAITFVSGFTYQLAGFFLGQDYEKPGPSWKEAKKAFKVYFRFIDDANTELVLNGTFAIFVLLWLTKQACWLQWLICVLCVMGKFFVNYRLGGELYSTYFGDEGIWGDIKKEQGKFKQWWFRFFYLYLLVLILLPFALLPKPSWLSWWEAQRVEHVALFVVAAHILFWILAAEIWRPGETLAKAKRIGSPEIDSWMIMQCHERAAEEYEENDRHRDRKADALINTATEMISAEYPMLKLLYAGCGPGEILQKLYAQQALWSEMLAIDFSQKVIELARNSFGFLPPYIELKKFDFMHIHEFKGTITPDNFDLVACLNNTLGNVVPRGVGLASIDRKECIAEFFKVLRPGGKLFLSVYNVEHLNKDPRTEIRYCHCKQSEETSRCCTAIATHLSKGKPYSNNLIIDEDLSDVDKGDLILKFISGDHSKTGSHSPDQLYFYSHWFSTGEVRRLLEDSGFVDVRVDREGNEKPPERIIAVGAKAR